MHFRPSQHGLSLKLHYKILGSGRQPRNLPATYFIPVEIELIVNAFRISCMFKASLLDRASNGNADEQSGD